MQATDTLQPLPLKVTRHVTNRIDDKQNQSLNERSRRHQTATTHSQKGDLMLMNFGLHDYNQGVGGVGEYTAEYRAGLHKVSGGMSAWVGVR